MNKDFDRWNEIKKITDLKAGQGVFYSEREVWWISLGLNIGVEIDGKHEFFNRPCVVVRKFNKDMALVVPMTRKEVENKYFMRLKAESGNVFIGCISQLRIISSKRMHRKIGTICEKDYNELLIRLCTMIRIGL